jgi:dephospho-CoA kinase
MIIVGLTGGIGSGKSVIADIFRVMGIPVYDSDIRSKQLCDTDEELKKDLKQFFGETIYNDGILNRYLLAEKIFKNNEALKYVNSLIHPAVGRDFISWISNNTSSSIVVQETAILFEAGLADKFDFIISVTAPVKLRLTRVCKRSGLSPDEVKNRMNNQISDESRIKQSDFVIINDGKKSLIDQIEKIITKIRDVKYPDK